MAMPLGLGGGVSGIEGFGMVDSIWYIFLDQWECCRADGQIDVQKTDRIDRKA
jgi:hypothetical protein